MPGIAFFRVAVVALCLWPASRLLRADVMVSTSIGLSQLTITPQSGSIQFVTPQNSPPGCTSPSLCATAFAQASDSLGGFDQQYNVADNGTATAKAFTLANATATASVPTLKASANSAVNIVGLEASASSSALGNPASFVGTFMVTVDTTLEISAMLTIDQSLFTDSAGLFASSETIFSVQLDNGDIPVFFDNPMSIGPNGSAALMQNLTLTGSTSMLLANADYSIFIQTDAESSGATMVPEPSASCLLVTVMGLSGLMRARRAHRRKSRASVPRVP
jgi:hypothetical protein